MGRIDVSICWNKLDQTISLTRPDPAKSIHVHRVAFIRTAPYESKPSKPSCSALLSVQEAASAATLAPAPPDLDRLMQAWSPEVQAQLQGSALPDPRQVSSTFMRSCLGLGQCHLSWAI